MMENVWWQLTWSRWRWYKWKRTENHSFKSVQHFLPHHLLHHDTLIQISQNKSLKHTSHPRSLNSGCGQRFFSQLSPGLQCFIGQFEAVLEFPQLEGLGGIQPTGIPYVALDPGWGKTVQLKRVRTVDAKTPAAHHWRLARTNVEPISWLGQNVPVPAPHCPGTKVSRRNGAQKRDHWGSTSSMNEHTPVGALEFCIWFGSLGLRSSWILHLPMTFPTLDVELPLPISQALLTIYPFFALRNSRTPMLL